MFQRLAAAVLLFTYYGASTPNNPNMPENYEESSSPGIYQLDCFSGSTSDLFFNRLNALFSCVVFSSSCSFLLCLTQFFLLSSLTHPILHITIIIGSQFCGLQNRHQNDHRPTTGMDSANFAGYNHHQNDPWPATDISERSQYNGYPLGGSYDQQGGTVPYRRGGPGGQSTTDMRHPVFGNDQLYNPRPPKDPPKPPSFEPEDQPEPPNKEEFSGPPSILDPSKTSPPAPVVSRILSVYPHAACLQGGCEITIVCTNCLPPGPCINNRCDTEVFIGDVPCINIVKKVLPPCPPCEPETTDDSSLVEIETNAYSQIVSASVLALRKEQRQQMLNGQRVADAYVGNRVVSPYIPPGRERIEFQRRVASRDGLSNDITTTTDDQNINPEHPFHNPQAAYHQYGGNFPIGVPNSYQYPPFTARPPVLPVTTEPVEEPPAPAPAPTPSSLCPDCPPERQGLTCVLSDARKTTRCGPTDVVVYSKTYGKSIFTPNQHTYFEYRCLQKPKIMAITPRAGPGNQIIAITISGPIGIVQNIHVGGITCDLGYEEVSGGGGHVQMQDAAVQEAEVRFHGTGALTNSGQPSPASKSFWDSYNEIQKIQKNKKKKHHALLRSYVMATQEAKSDAMLETAEQSNAIQFLRDKMKKHHFDMDDFVSFLQVQEQSRDNYIREIRENQPDMSKNLAPGQAPGALTDEEQRKFQAGETLKWNFTAKCEEPCLEVQELKCKLRCCCCGECKVDQPVSVIIGTTTQNVIYEKEINYEFQGPCVYRPEDSNVCRECSLREPSPSPSPIPTPSPTPSPTPAPSPSVIPPPLHPHHQLSLLLP